ncbi:MAG: ferrous iron transporter B, partial [Candidatus Omnitrophica bacterium]|nr:ferrous iron transporter B [Candidatus Omnitrophota bacterium]
MGKIKKIAIVGLPNTGKSQIFNSLTGEYTTVANYPGTTIEMKRSIVSIGAQEYEVIDTPSLHCLYIHSEEELAVRDMLFSEQPDVIIQCIDATHHKQSLMLTADLMELGIPMVIALNAVDESLRKGLWVGSAELEKFLGVPVVESMAIRSVGKEELKKTVLRAKKGAAAPSYGGSTENDIAAISAIFPEDASFKRKIAVLLLLRDPFIEKFLEIKYGKETVSRAIEEVNKIRHRAKYDIGRLINNRRGHWVENVSLQCVKKNKMTDTGFSHYFTYASRHPVMGVPILLVFMAAVFFSVVHTSVAINRFLENLVVIPSVHFVKALPLPLFWTDFLVGKHGILTLGIFNALCTVLPILSTFFFIFGLFEDSGYIANFCVLSKRIFESIGVTGKAITSFVLGFACKTMATLNAKALKSYKEKFITIFLIAFAIPCSAQMGISMVILGKIGILACVIAFGTLGVFALGAGLILNAVLKEEVESCFIEVVPPMRLPGIRAVLVKTYHRIVDFLKEAIPIFMASAVMLFIFDKIGFLDLTKKILDPVIVRWMGLPRDILDVFMLA